MNIGRLSCKAILLCVFLSTAGGALAQRGDGLDEARAAHEAKDYTTAMRLLRPLAEKGHARAQYGVGLLYLQGLGVDRNYDEARQWFLKAAEQDEPLAPYALGLLYIQPAYVKRDYAEAAKWLRKAADQGHAVAQVLLGTLYGTGDGVPRDPAEAIKWYRKADEQNFADAQWRIATMYAAGDGVSVDYGEAEKWFRKAASQEHAAGYFGLGHLYLNGLGVTKNVAEAAKWFKLALGKDSSARLDQIEFQSNASLRALTGELFERALLASAGDLASSYMSVKVLLQLIPTAESGGIIETPRGRIDAANAGAAKLEMQKRLSTYGTAIAGRAFEAIAGRYSASAHESCERIGSMWAAGLRMGKLLELSVSQEGFEIEITQSLEIDGKWFTVRIPGVVAESMLAFLEPSNSELMFSGKVADGEIIIRPRDVETILAAWPKWAGPPSRSDLSQCSVKLVRTAR